MNVIITVDADARAARIPLWEDDAVAFCVCQNALKDHLDQPKIYVPSSIAVSDTDRYLACLDAIVSIALEWNNDTGLHYSRLRSTQAICGGDEITSTLVIAYTIKKDASKVVV